MIFLWLVVRDQIMIPLEGLGLILVGTVFLMLEAPAILMMVAMLVAMVVLH